MTGAKATLEIVLGKKVSRVTMGCSSSNSIVCLDMGKPKEEPRNCSCPQLYKFLIPYSSSKYWVLPRRWHSMQACETTGMHPFAWAEAAAWGSKILLHYHAQWPLWLEWSQGWVHFLLVNTRCSSAGQDVTLLPFQLSGSTWIKLRLAGRWNVGPWWTCSFRGAWVRRECLV